MPRPFVRSLRSFRCLTELSEILATSERLFGVRRADDGVRIGRTFRYVGVAASRAAAAARSATERAVIDLRE